MSHVLIPNELSSKLANLSWTLKHASEFTTQINQLRDQLASKGPSTLEAQRLAVLYSRAIQLSREEQDLTAACVRSLESVLRPVSTSTKRGAGAALAAENNARADCGCRGGAATAAACTTGGNAQLETNGGGAASSGMNSAPKPKRAKSGEGINESAIRAPSPSPSDFPESLLESVTGEAAEAQLCGAVPVPADHSLPIGARVVSRLSGPKVTPQHWAVGIVVRHIQPKSKYVLRDEEPGVGASSAHIKQHTITTKYVVPLPTSLPAASAYSARNVFAKGTRVLAMYPSTSRFIKGTVDASPGELSGRRSYIVSFDPAEVDPGAALTVAVPPSFIVELPACLSLVENS